MRTGSGHSGQRIQRGLAGGFITQTSGHRQHKQGGIVPGSATRFGDLGHAFNHTHTICIQQAGNGFGVFDAQFSLAGVVGSALATEDEEAIQAIPVVDRPGMAAGRVGNLAGTRNRSGLWG